MSIDSLPPPLQPLIQSGYLYHSFGDGLQSKLGFRAIADRERFAIGIGEIITKTRAELLILSTHQILRFHDQSRRAGYRLYVSSSRSRVRLGSVKQG